jgi:AIPR protein
MSGNDIILLDNTLEQKKSEIYTALSDSDFFELFSFEQVLKNFDLSYDELLTGKVGTGADGGIDGFFTFVNGELCDEDTDFSEFKRSPLIETFLIQAKRSPSFSEIAVERVDGTATDIFNLQNDLNDFKSVYNNQLLERVAIFRKAFLDLAARHPRLKIFYIYCTRGNTSAIHPNVIHKSDALKNKISNYLPGAGIDTRFMGARELLDESRIEKTYTLQLKFRENYISTGDDNYIVLASLPDYWSFISDENGYLRRYIFESNVRDYQGNVEVNRDILQTLQSASGIDFWWMNNGITVLTSKASVAGKTITLDDVQIVNGLQTSTVIYDYLKEKQIEEKDKSRSVLLRILVIDSSEERDNIIKATNFQTAIPPASLKATDRIQRNIEDFFLRHDYYYDRRKNYYKNAGKPAGKIISIPYLAQSVMAMVLREPDNARARPSSLIKKEQDYRRVFNESLDLSIYLFCAKTMKKIDAFIKTKDTGFSMRDKSDLKFHVATLLVTHMLENINYNPSDLKPLVILELTDDEIKKALSETLNIAQLYSEFSKLPIERIAKNKDFVTILLEKITI